MHCILKITLTEYICQEKKENEDLSALKTVLTHQYKNLKTKQKSAEKDWLQPPEKMVTIQGSTEQRKLENKMGEKQFYGRLSDEYTTSHMRKSGRG